MALRTLGGGLLCLWQSPSRSPSQPGAEPSVTLVWMTCCGKSLMAFVSQPSKLLAKLRMACVKVPGRHKP